MTRRKKAPPDEDSPLVRHILTRMIQAGLPEPAREFIFAPPRKWRFDLCYPAPLMIGIEAEGGTWGRRRSRHTTAIGYRNDCEKYSNAAIMGWMVLRFTTDMIEDDSFLDYIIRAIESRNERKLAT